MALEVQTVKLADGICDVKVVRYFGRDCLAASFGTETRIYDAARVELQTVATQDFIQAIVPHGDAFFLIGYKTVYTYRDSECVLVKPARWPWTKLLGVECVGDGVVFLHDGGYLTGVVQNDEIVCSQKANDSSFYKILSYAAGSSEGSTDAPAGECLYVLSRTFTKTFFCALRFDGAAGLVASTREVSPALSVFSHRGQLYSIDRVGVRRLGSPGELLQELGNVFVSVAYADSVYDRVLLFCNNGEVTELSGDDLSPHVVLDLHCRVHTVRRVGSHYLAASALCAFWISSDYRIVQTLPCTGSVQPAYHTADMLVGLGAQCAMRVEKAIRLEKVAGTTDSIVAGQLQKFYKLRSADVLCYDKFSVVSGEICAPVHSAFDVSGVSVILTSDLVCCIGSQYCILPLPSLFAQACGDILYFYASDRLFAFDVASGTVKAATAPSEAYSIVCANDEPQLVLWDGATRPIPLDSFSPVDTVAAVCTREELLRAIAIPDAVCDSAIVARHSELIAGLPLTLQHSELYAVGGKVFRWSAGKAELLHDFGEFIAAVIPFRDGFIAASLSATYFHSSTLDAPVRLALHAFPVGLEGDSSTKGCFDGRAAFIHDNSLYAVRSLDPAFVFSASDLGCKPEHTVVYHDHLYTVTACAMLSKTACALYLNDREALILDDVHFVCSSYIDTGLLAVVGFSASAKRSTVFFVHINKNRLRTMARFNDDSIPIACASTHGLLAVIFADSIRYFDTARDRIRPADAFIERNDSVVKAWFLAEDRLVLQMQGSSYKIVDRHRTVTEYHNKSTSFPFELDGKLGNAMDRRVFWEGACIDIMDSIANVVTLPHSVLVLCTSGKVLMLSEGAASSSYSTCDAACTDFSVRSQDVNTGAALALH
ncbi:hypothetical protein PAPHI01_0393 [Pancytospora philotis]|nr:hypothetical protein PAPHI01_0393 [Pancytospora philotis]